MIVVMAFPTQTGQTRRMVRSRLYLVFIPMALLAFLLALWAGLLRMGWDLPTLPGGSLAQTHGPLMISGFLGTLITLERAVAIRAPWMLLAPACTALGWVMLLGAPESYPGAILLTLGSGLGSLILVAMIRREPAVHTWVMGAGAACWLIGNSLWLAGRAVPGVAPFWLAWLVLTIAGERLELNRVMRLSRRALLGFASLCTLLVLGVAFSLLNADVGARLAGLGMLTLALWFARYDLALRNLRHRLSLTRYIAWCLSLGFVWLGLGGALYIGYGAQYAGLIYDAQVHAVLVGFVISMIFGHAPIIFPAILGRPFAFGRRFYVPLVALQLTLVLRIGGDLAAAMIVRQWGGMLNTAAILLFLAAVAQAMGPQRYARGALSNPRSTGT
jgi:hypothetical protein